MEHSVDAFSGNIEVATEEGSPTSVTGVADAERSLTSGPGVSAAKGSPTSVTCVAEGSPTSVLGVAAAKGSPISVPSVATAEGRRPKGQAPLIAAAERSSIPVSGVDPAEWSRTPVQAAAEHEFGDPNDNGKISTAVHSGKMQRGILDLDQLDSGGLIDRPLDLPVEAKYGSSIDCLHGKIESESNTLELTSLAQNQAKQGRLRELLHSVTLLRMSDREAARLRKITCLSFLLAMVTAVMLWFSRGKPLLIVWRLSVMLCYGSFFWTNFLMKTLGARTLFVYISYGSLLAYFAHNALSPAIGVVIIHLNSHFAAGLMGYALAERRQLQGIERSASAIPILMDYEEVKRLRVLRFIGGLILAGPALVLAGVSAWLVWHSADYGADELVLNILALLLSGLMLSIFAVAMFQLRGALISPERFGFVLIYFGLIAMIRVCSPEVLGNVTGMVISWFAILPLAGLFGYCLCVLASFKQRVLMSTGVIGKKEKLEQLLKEKEKLSGGMVRSEQGKLEQTLKEQPSGCMVERKQGRAPDGDKHQSEEPDKDEQVT